VVAVKVIFGFLKKIEGLFGKGKDGPLSRNGGKSSVECHGHSRESGKRAARHGRKDNFGRAGGITIQDSLNTIALHLQELLRFRLRWFHQAVSNGFSLSLSQPWWKSYLTRPGIIGGANNIIIPALVDIAPLKSLWLLLDISNTPYGMSEKIDNIALECRASQYACCKRSEATRPSLKSGRKIEAVSVAQ
jgi:hypothetical protein